MGSKDLIYFDHNATTPVRPEALEAMLPYLREEYANPNSVHSFGQRARRAVERAREQVAALLGAESPSEVIFTSCGSEADVLALWGGAWAERDRTQGAKRRVVTTQIEHEAVLATCRRLARRDFEVVTAGVDGTGRVLPEAVAAAADASAAVVSVMFANNEVGTLQPVAELAAHCRERGVLFHTDAVQAAGKVPLDARGLGADLLSVSGHKLNAPKGVGALYVRKGTRLEAVISGHQEKNRRGGTENVAGIVGFGAAAELALRELEGHARELRALRDRLEAGVSALPGAHRTSRAQERLPGTAHFCFDGVDGHNLVVALDLEGVCVSSGPACSGGMTELSHVLKAMGVPEKLGRGALRVSLGRGCTEAQVDRFLAVLPRALEKLRKAVPA